MHALDEALSSAPAAAHVWEQVPADQQDLVRDHIAKARTEHGRRKRAHELTEVLTSEGAAGIEMWLAAPRGWEELAALEATD